jgi:hypothetical protein
MSKKTVNVKEMYELMQNVLDHAKSDDARISVSLLIESLLMKSGHYGGFGYVDWFNGGSKAWDESGRPTDNTPFLGNQTKKFYHFKE